MDRSPNNGTGVARDQTADVASPAEAASTRLTENIQTMNAADFVTLVAAADMQQPDEVIKSHGGMIEVYRIQNPNPILDNRQELLHVISAPHAAHTARERLIREVVTIARLQHPSIVQVYNVGVHQGTSQLFFTTPVDCGQDLRAHIDQMAERGRGMTPCDAAELVCCVASALAAAHERGILHCDLKPESIRVGEDEVARVTDFGVAQLMSSDTAFEHDAGVEGAPQYMSPEQARGETLDRRSDVYGLGAVFYELLTLQPPQRGAHLVRPRKIRAEIPEDLEEICLQCLCADREQRYATAGALEKALAAALHHTQPGGTSDHARMGDTLVDIRCDMSDDVRHFGSYELVRNKPIGRGGMGKVYRVRNSNPVLGHRIEALKVITARRATPDAREQFIGEVAAMAKLQHPNIVSVYNAGEEHDQLFYTMSLEEGGDLAQLVERNRTGNLRPGEEELSSARAARIVCSVARAIDSAHENGILHRDLKPANILLSADGVPKVSDFGLAQLMSPGAITAAENTCKGTPSYMSPEQANREQLDTRTDIYSLGAILYELLTKRPPFSSRKAGVAGVLEVMDAVREHPLDPPSDFNPDVPPQLEAICLKCLHKNRERRYDTAGELAEALEALLRPSAPWRISRRALVATVVGGLLLVAFGWLWSLWSGQTASRRKAAVLVAEAEQHQHDILYQEALRKYGDAQHVYESLIETRPLFLDRDQLRISWARVQIQRAVLLENSGSLRDAEEIIHGVLDYLQNLLNSSLASDADCKILLAEAHHQDAQHHARVERQRALESYGAAIALRQQLCDLWPDRRDHARNLARGFGYMADTQLELDDLSGAESSYKTAEAIRRKLASDRNAADHLDAVCLHARDFGNWSRYFLWQGDVHEAACRAQQRLDYYATHVPSGFLPSEFLTERAEAYLTAAELELDQSTAAFDDVPKWLEKARREYDRLLAASDERMFEALCAKRARVDLIYGKYCLLRRQNEAARASLQEALNVLQAKPGDKSKAEDHYDLASIHALLACLCDDPKQCGYHEGTALDALKDAIEAGFRNAKKIECDRSFANLGQELKESTIREWIDTAREQSDRKRHLH